MESYGGIFDVEAKRERLTTLEQRMSATGFWDDQDEAQAVVQEVKVLKGWVEPYDRITGRVNSALELEELLAEELDAGMSADLDTELRTIESELDAFELRSLLRGPDDFRDFTFTNMVKLHGGLNRDFYKGTVVEEQAAKVLNG